MNVGQAAPQLGGDGALVGGIAVCVQQADGDRFGLEFRQRLRLDRRELGVGTHAPANAEAAIQRHEWLRMRLAQTVERSTVLPAQVEQVLEAGVRHEGSARALALEQCVRRNRRAVREAVDARGADGPRSREHRLLLPGGGRHLRGADLAVAEEDGIGKRSTYVDAEHPHSAHDRGVAARRRGPRAGRLPSNTRFARRRSAAAFADRRGGVDARGDAADSAWRANGSPVVRGQRVGRCRGRRRGRRARTGSAARPAPSHVQAGRGSVAVLSRRPRRSTAFLGSRRRRPDAAQSDRLRGRRQDDLHHELRVGRNRAHGHGARREPRGRCARRSPHLSDRRGDGGRRRRLLPRRRARRLPRRLPPRTRGRRRVGRARPRGA